MFKKYLALTVVLALPLMARGADDAKPTPAAKPEKKPMVEVHKETIKEEAREAGNKFTRFFTHTIGEPLTKGVKFGARKIEDGFN